MPILPLQGALCSTWLPDMRDAAADVTGHKVQGFYSATLEALTGASNERLWFKTQLKLCGLWFGLKEFSRAAKILKELHRLASPLVVLATAQHIMVQMCPGSA